MNFFKLPLLSPFKFVPSTNAPGYDMDSRYFCEQILDWELKTNYFQKWVKTDRTKLQCQSTVFPDPLKIYDANINLIKTIDWHIVVNASTYKTYELLFNVSDISNQRIILYQRAALADGVTIWEALSEPIDLGDVWPGTITALYGHSFNDYDVMFTTGIQYLFRHEGAITEFQPDRDSTEYVDSTHSVQLLRAVPFRVFKWNIGNGAGVPPWVLDLLNRIACCDYINIMGKQFAANVGAKWEITRQRGYPMYGGSLEVVDSANGMSLEFNDAALGRPGFITAYEIETTFFGPGTIIPITDIETD